VLLSYDERLARCASVDEGVSAPSRCSDPGIVEVIWRCWRYIGAVPSVQVKNVPSETHAVLRQRAAAAGQSLQEYLRQRLIEEAATPTVEEILARAGGRAGGSVPFAEAVAALREDRDRR
jgi:plasmid stability protein